MKHRTPALRPNAVKSRQGEGDVTMERTHAPGTIHLSAPTSSARNTSFGTPSRDSSTAAPRVTMSLTASLRLRLIFVRTVGRSTTREWNAMNCIDISAVRCSGRLVVGAGYGRGAYGSWYGASGLVRNALGNA